MKQFSLIFLCSMSCLHWIANKQQAILLALVALAFVCIYWLLSAFKSTNRYIKNGRFVVPLAIGFVWGSFTVLQWLSTVPKLLPKPNVHQVEGYVCSIPIHDNNHRISFNFCIEKLDEFLLPYLYRNKVRLTLYRAPESIKNLLKAGSFWQFTTKLKPIHGRLNPGGFDYEKWLVSENFIGTGYVKKYFNLESPDTLQSNYHAIRQDVMDAVSGLLPESRHRGLILALAVGDRSQISHEQWQAVQGSGTSHLLAISGLHIGIAALWSYFLVLFVVKRITFVISRFPAQRIAEVGSLLGATTITLLSGLGYPAQRALIMLSVFLIFKWLGRSLSGANTLALAVVIILLLQPFAILTISFWLSVLAVMIIVMLTSYQGDSNGKAAALKGWLRLNWYLFLSLLPITWLIFDSISIVGFMANVILIPLTSFITTPLIYLGMLILPVSVNLASWIYILVDWMMFFTLLIQEFFASINKSLTVSSLNLMEFGLLMIGILFLLLPDKIPGKKVAYPIFILLAFSFVPSNWYFANAEIETDVNQPQTAGVITTQKPEEVLKLVVFDIGQGLAVYVNKGRNNLLYDTGYGNKHFSMSKSSLLPYLRRNGIHQLNQVIISHGDSDHAGGLDDLLKQIMVNQIFSGEPLSVATSSCHEFINTTELPRWNWGETTFSFVEHSVAGLEGNNASCVLLIEHLGNRILLTGDIEKSAERRLIQNDKNRFLQGVDVVVSPHHGSLTSSTEKFVQYLAPKIAIHSAGYANQWGFPKTAVLQRYTNVNSTNYITHEQGAITVTISNISGLTITTERESRSHFWY